MDSELEQGEKGREGGRERGREGARKGAREGVREGGRERGRERTEGGWEEGRRGREGGREGKEGGWEEGRETKGNPEKEKKNTIHTNTCMTVVSKLEKRGSPSLPPNTDQTKK